MEGDKLYKIALSMTKGVNSSLVRAMDDMGIDPETFFMLSSSELNDRINPCKRKIFQQLDKDEALMRARKELEFVQRHNIRVYFILDDDYPVLLLESSDPPVVLYQLGDADLNVPQSLSMVGTRKCTPIGVEWCSRFVSDIHAYYPDIMIVSGLAYGIDEASHKACLDNNVMTVAVVAHGLDTIYPASHRDLARRILKAGGAIVTEYPSGTSAMPGNFLARNRIIAGLCELTIVVESEIKGGAMSTANYAFMDNREVMAVPGRFNDQKSAGCNLLIRKQKASLVGCAADVVEYMNWTPLNNQIKPNQRNLFPELAGEAKEIYEILKNEADPVQIDRLLQFTRIQISTLLTTLSELEFDGVVIKHPGNRYSLA